MWEEIVIVGASLLALLFGAYWRIARRLMKSAGELLAEASKAMEDGKLTQAEFAVILSKIRQLLSGTP